MKRNLYPKLVAWKQEKHRKPLILRGARQVGKTTLLKSFGEKEFERNVYLNFEEDPHLSSLFQSKLDPQLLIEHLQLYTHQPILPETTLLIFDEIQACPEALNSLKYFQERAPEYAIAAAGSLLGVKLVDLKGFPVGKVHFMDLYPLSFFEFLSAMGYEDLRHFLESLDSVLQPSQKIPTPIHDELMKLMKYYLFLGGMPEVIADFVESRDFLHARVLQTDILAAYTFDFAKHAKATDVMKISAIWDAIPGQLARENKKFIFSALSSSARAREYEVALRWLIDAGLIYPSYAVHTPKLPMTHYAENAFKVFLFDVGLLSAKSQLSSRILMEGSSIFIEFKGALTENFVAQQLKMRADLDLYYWTSHGEAEIDFLIPHEQAIYPLEAKGGASTKNKSLWVYDKKYEPELLIRTNTRELNFDGKILNIPLYLIEQLPLLLDSKINHSSSAQ